jgi:hypothetical protein
VSYRSAFSPVKAVSGFATLIMSVRIAGIQRLKKFRAEKEIPGKRGIVS